MAKISFDHCVIHVSDWDRSNRFYADIVGAELIPRDVGWAYRFGDVQLNVHGPGVEPNPVAAVPVPPGGSDICFRFHATVDEAATHLATHGITVELGPVRSTGAAGPGKSVYFRDPDGSLLEFICYKRL